MAENRTNAHNTPVAEKGSTFLTRQNRLASLMSDTGLSAAVVNPGPSLVYLTGLHFHLNERPVVAIFVPQSPPVLVMPELEARKADGLPFPARVFFYGEDPAGWPAVFRQAVEAAGIEDQKIAVEAGRLRVLELRLMEAAAPQARFVSAESPVAELRRTKDEDEIQAMRQAADIAQRALQATLPQIRAGVTERQIAAELTQQLLRAGSDPEMPFAPIVSGGPNSANPHAVPTDRPLQPGDLLVIDWGASYNGYFSDITRTFAVGAISPELAHIHQIVQQANQVGRSAVRPGITAGEVDQGTREVIEEAGFGEYFTHRTGHGLGMESHEEPYIRSGNNVTLRPGMTFTVEPGIYLPGKGGVRIEDDVVVTPGGMDSLTDLPREIIQVG